MGREPWSTRLTVEECRSLRIASLATAGLFRYASPQTRMVWSRGLGITATCLAPTSNVDEWVWNGTSDVKLPAIGSRLRLSFTLGKTGSESIDLPESEGGRRVLCLRGEQHVELEVEIVSIPSPLRRGKRCYFLCPGIGGKDGCGKRVGILYMPPGQAHFACRTCCDLTYQSVKEHDSRVDRMVRELGPMVAELTIQDAAERLVRCAFGNQVVLKAMLRIMKRERKR